MGTRRFGSMLPLIIALAVPLAGAGASAAPVPPVTCDDPAVLRLVGAGLHFRGEVPEGFRAAEQGLRNPETGEVIAVEVAESPEGAEIRVGESRIELRNVRTTGETADGWRCRADFTLHQGDAALEGDARYVSEIVDMAFRVRGRFTIEGVEVSF